ncbi:MAG TPA: serine/threonine-protein kinase, partial [Pyrinomonadaceae bacterium]
MNLESGTKLGRYEVISLLGAGGMGQVYLAHDSQLNRKIALKILPSDFTSDRDRLRRFKQEATAAASLNHPGIAHIYELAEVDGIQLIAMEYVEGETLTKKIHQSQTDLPKLLRHLQHVAEGLAKAHDSGVVHRDLKPDNIMITPDGHVKILDFGLAKLVELDQSSILTTSGTEAVTVLQQSVPGIILGTTGYMSPEQAQGKNREIDGRSDIFSFGCILFEAITGQRPFTGNDHIEILNKLIREPAPLLASLNPDAPADLQRIVRRCLAKDPDERYQNIKDIAIELKEVRREMLESGLESSVPLISSASEAQTIRIQSQRPTAESPARTSSAEFIVNGLKRHKMAATAGALLILIAAAAFGIRSYLHASSTEVAVESIAV